ncbi:fimbrial protein [Pseudomonas solani]|uniref:fimbrial protein n=1 Tax=Pseudomonas solani TaxID=2731552 RepID=UPI0035BE6225
MKDNLLFATLLFAAMAQHSLTASAADNMKFTGKLVEPPSCTISGGKPIEVAFGDVRTDQVDGTNFKKTVDYGLKCQNADNKALKLSINGTAAPFDAAVLTTSAADLGIKLYLDDAALEVNKKRDFTYPKAPVLAVVPVKKSGSTLKAGDFTAAATLKVEYE